MGPKGAVEIIFKKEIESSKNPDLELENKLNEYIQKFANPYIAAERGFLDDVIEPKNTKKVLINAFELLIDKVDLNPRKKHNNIPL